MLKPLPCSFHKRGKSPSSAAAMYTRSLDYGSCVLEFLTAVKVPETLYPDYRAQALSLLPGTAYPARMSALDMAAFTTITDNLWRASWYAFLFHGSCLRAQGVGQLHISGVVLVSGKESPCPQTRPLLSEPIIPVLAACSVVGGAFLYLDILPVAPFDLGVLLIFVAWSACSSYCYSASYSLYFAHPFSCNSDLLFATLSWVLRPPLDLGSTPKSSGGGAGRI